MDLRNVVKDLKTQIDDFIENNSTKELEFVFGRSIKPNNYYSKINKGLFQDLLRRLNSLDFQKDDIEQLDIIVNDSDIRATLVGRQNIVLYCKENMDVLDNLTYDYKKPDARKSHVEIVNYGIRSNLKVEIPMGLKQYKMPLHNNIATKSVDNFGVYRIEFSIQKKRKSFFGRLFGWLF